MSEQAKIIAQMHQLIMNILKNGSTSVQEADRMDELETLLFKQNSFKKIEDAHHTYQGEVIATLFFNNEYAKAIDKLRECDITPEDFFGFIDYYYDDEHEDEALTQMFTHAFIAGVHQDYQSH